MVDKKFSKIMKNKKYSNLFSEKILNEVPLFYFFLRKTSSEIESKIELYDIEVCVSSIHRSSTYLLFEDYKPHSKFNVLNKMIKDEKK